MEELVKLEAKRKKSFIFFLIGVVSLVIGVLTFVIVLSL